MTCSLAGVLFYENTLPCHIPIVFVLITLLAISYLYPKLPVTKVVGGSPIKPIVKLILALTISEHERS